MARVHNRNSKAGIHARISPHSRRNRGYGIVNIPNATFVTNTISENEYLENENEIYELKKEKLKLLSKKVVLENNLKGSAFKKADLTEFTKLFPNANYIEFAKIDAYHIQLNNLLKNEIENEIENIELRIEQINDEIEELITLNETVDTTTENPVPDGYAKQIPNIETPGVVKVIPKIVDNIEIDDQFIIDIQNKIKQMKESEKVSYLSRLLYMAGLDSNNLIKETINTLKNISDSKLVDSNDE